MQISLSEALRRGASLPPNEVRDPLIFALKGMGALPPDLDANNRYFVPDRGYGWEKTLAYPKEAIVERRPWMKEKLPCPWCAKPLTGANIVSHPFIQHDDEIDLEDGCGWLEVMEEHPERRSALAVYFPSESERSRVLRTARDLLVTPSELMGAAIRLALELRIPLQTVPLIQ